MRSGIIFPSVGRDAVWTQVGGAWAPNYPASNLANLDEIARVGRSTSASMSAKALFPAPVSINAMALIAHTLTGITTVRVYAFSGVDSDPVTDAADIVYDSGAMLVWPATTPVDGYAWVRPILFSQTILARSFFVQISSPVSNIEVGAIDFGTAWIWPGISYGREIGVRGGDEDLDLVGGASAPKPDNVARTVDAMVDLMAMATTSSIGLDFQKGLDINVPFVFAQDFDDP